MNVLDSLKYHEETLSGYAAECSYFSLGEIGLSEMTEKNILLAVLVIAIGLNSEHESRFSDRFSDR